MTIIKRRINGSGPYAYRVTYSDGKHNWEYLGPVGAIDPKSLTESERDELAEQDQLARYRDLSTAQFAKRDVANATRDELVERWGEDVLAFGDDRRTQEIILADDAPQAAERIAVGRAEDNREANRTVGQEPLTQAERERIDFTDTSIMHARASKAVIRDEGIDDWTAIYDPQVEDPAAMRERAEANRESVQGDRLDNEQQPRSTGFEEAESRMERQALEGAREGFEEAAEELRTTHGWTDEQIAEAVA